MSVAAALLSLCLLAPSADAGPPDAPSSAAGIGRARPGRRTSRDASTLGTADASARRLGDARVRRRAPDLGLDAGVGPVDVGAGAVSPDVLEVGEDAGVADSEAAGVSDPVGGTSAASGLGLDAGTGEADVGLATRARQRVLERINQLEQEVPQLQGQSSSLLRLLMGLVLALLVVMSGRSAKRARERFGPSGLIPRVLGFLAKVAGTVALALVLWGGIAVIPTVAPELRWAATIGALVVLAMAARGVLPDLFATLVLLLERRIRPGDRVDGTDLAGVVERIGWRSTRLATPEGDLDVPNRNLLGPIRRSRATRHETSITVPIPLPAVEGRRLLEDAVLASAWVPPAPRAHARRDPTHERRWIVSTYLLDPSFAPAFEADLPERLERLCARLRVDAEEEGAD